MIKKTSSLIVLVILAFSLSSCSVVQATHSPDVKDLSVFNVGTDRFVVLAEMGKPVVSEENSAGNKIDVFKFNQGQHGAVKVGKGLVYGVLAVGTLGLSEIVTSPLEGAIGDGAEIQAKVTYDNDGAVSVVDILKDDRWLPVQNIK